MKQIQILLVFFLPLTLVVRAKHERHKRTSYLINNWRNYIHPKNIYSAQVLEPTVIKAYSTNKSPESATLLHDSRYLFYNKYNGIYVTPVTSKELAPNINQWISQHQDVEQSGLLSLLAPFIAGGKYTPETSVKLLKNTVEKSHIPNSFSFPTSEAQKDILSSKIFKPMGTRLKDFYNHKITALPSSFYNLLDKNVQNQQIKEIKNLKDNLPIKSIPELPLSPEAVFQSSNSINQYSNNKVEKKFKTIQHVPIKQVRKTETNTNNIEVQNSNEEDYSTFSENEQLEVAVNIENNSVNTTTYPRYTVVRNVINRRNHSTRVLSPKMGKRKFAPSSSRRRHVIKSV